MRIKKGKKRKMVKDIRDAGGIPHHCSRLSDVEPVEPVEPALDHVLQNRAIRETPRSTSSYLNPDDPDSAGLTPAQQQQAGDTVLLLALPFFHLPALS